MLPVLGVPSTESIGVLAAKILRVPGRPKYFEVLRRPNTESTESVGSTETREYRQICTRSIETRNDWTTGNIRSTEPRDTGY